MAQARSGPPRIPPRIDLGENEDVSTIRHDEAPTDETISVNESASFTTDTKDEPVATQKPLPQPLPSPLPKSSMMTKPELRPAAKATNPSKKKEAKKRPEISIVSARPMDQSNFVSSTNLKNENGTPHEGIDNNNSSNKPSVPPIESVKKTDVENKKPAKPAPPPPKKPSAYIPSTQGNSANPSDSSPPSKVVSTPRRMKTKNTKKEQSFSKFYVDTDVDFKQSKQDQPMSSKTKAQHSSSDISVKSVDKPILPAPRKNKRKEEQIKNAVETESSVLHKQPETAASKPKLRPTIITAKKPKNTDVSGSNKISNASPNIAVQLEDNSGSNLAQSLVQVNPPHRPNCPPSTVVEEPNKEMPQPQRPKAPPNTIHEDQKHPSKLDNKDDRQKDLKNKDSVQKRPKSKPPRPPMAKESARAKPTRPALSNVESNKTPCVKAEALSVSGGKATNRMSSPHAIAKFDYAGETTDDLPFKAGDTILLTSKVDSDWLLGYLESNVMQQGLVPVSFVDIIVNVKEENPQEKVQEPVSSDPRAVAVHDFIGQADGELSFSSGQTIILIERINDHWLKGKINDNVGIFPLNFVRIESDLPESAVKPVVLQAYDDKSTDKKPDSEWCRAIHDFKGQHEDDLSFVVGNEIKITKRLDNDWLDGELLGKSGIFPASFVEMISESVAKTSTDVTVVTALHDYPGETAEDLSFNVGDKIKLVKRINSDWLMGEFNGKEGLFPASFVESVPESLPAEPSTSNKEVTQPKDTARFAKAVHDFNGENPGELNFKVGEIIQVIREIDNNWCEGMINNISGIFPTSFIEMELSQRKADISHAKALYDFDGPSEQDLSFKVGDVIELLERVNEDWWTGSFHGKTGHFPAKFVDIVANPS